jgi:serine/threonine-protein kinase
MAAMSADWQPGSVVGSYELVAPIGKGGMGAVWRARHQRLRDKQVAIKVLHASVAQSSGPGHGGEAWQRFKREAEIAARIGHPNIVDVLDFDTLPSGEPYIVLELLRGRSLRDRLAQGSLPVAEAFDIARQIGSALQAAHALGVIHRDLKPENVFLVPTDSGGVIRDHVKVLDFGISKLKGSQTLQTQEAVVLGTPQYMAPEQATGRNAEVDAQTDVFALAAIVHELLLGRPPFVADTPLGVMWKVVYEPTPPLGPQLPHLSAQAVAAIERALRKDKQERWPSVSAFIEALTGKPLHVLGATPSMGSLTTSLDRPTDEVMATAQGVVTAETELATPPVATRQVDVFAATEAGTPPVSGLPPAPVPEAPVVPAAPQTAPAAEPERPAPTSSARNRWAWWAASAAVLVAGAAAVHATRSPSAQAPGAAPRPEVAPQVAVVPGVVPTSQRLAAPPIPDLHLPPAVRTAASVAIAVAPTPVAPEEALPSPAAGSRPGVAPPAVAAAAAPAKAEAGGKQPKLKTNDLATHGDEAPEGEGDGPELAEALDVLGAEPQRALQLAERLLRASRSPRACVMAVRAACRLGDQAKAQAWFRQAPRRRQAALRSECARAGIEL